MLKVFALSLLLACLMCFGVAGARADATDDALAHFAQDKFPETEKGIDALAASGTPTAATVLDALAANRLLFDPGTKQVFYRDASDTLFDAKTGAKADSGATLKKVRLNNGVRSKLQAVGGSMDLIAADPVKRRDAANAVFASHAPNQLTPLEAALVKETDPSAKAALLQARAAILATMPDATPDQRIEAIDVLKLRGDQDALGLLTPLSTMAPDDASMDKVRTAAKGAMSAINTQLALWRAVQNIWYGLSLGSVLLLAAIGLAITFGVMGIINMAHGEMVMIGAYTTYLVQEVIRTSMPALFDVSLFIAIPLAFLASGAVGIAIERLVIRHLYGRPLETLLATWGISLILQQAVRTTFGPNNKEVGAPSFMAGSFHLGGLEITSGRMWIIAFTIAVFFALQAVLRATPFGLRMRAVTQNRRMASAMGISTGRIDALAFGLGSGIAGIAGVALSQIDNVSPNLGQSYIIDSFMVVVFGGVGNLWGTLVAALTLGIANKFLEPVAGAVLAKIVVLVFIILFIQKRPRGLFALKGRAVEA